MELRRKLTYANVVASISLLLVLGGATAFAATQLAKNSVGTKQLKAGVVTAAKLKKNAVTASKLRKDAVIAAKVKDGSLTGSDIQVSTLGVLRAATANAVAGRTPFSFFMSAGVRDVATVGPFTIRATCVIDPGGDSGELLLHTSVDDAAAAGGAGEAADFDVADGPLELVQDTETSGEVDIERNQSTRAIGPDTTAIAVADPFLGLNVPGHPGQCFFSGVVVKLGGPSVVAVLLQ